MTAIFILANLIVFAAIITAILKSNLQAKKLFVETKDENKITNTVIVYTVARIMIAACVLLFPMNALAVVISLATLYYANQIVVFVKSKLNRKSKEVKLLK